MADFGFIPNLIASADIYPFRFVTLSGAFTGAAAGAANKKIVGATDGSVSVFNGSFNATYDAVAQQGTPVNMQSTNTIQIEVGTGGCSAGSYLTSEAGGKAVVATTGQTSFYLALEAGAAGDIIRAFRNGPVVV